MQEGHYVGKACTRGTLFYKTLVLKGQYVTEIPFEEEHCVTETPVQEHVISETHVQADIILRKHRRKRDII